ncbi:MAG: hypothetical protein R6W91_07170, partial [Thermoplasmata archaeon]
TTGSVSGGAQVGGLLGNSYSGTIQYSYSTANVTGSTYMGGLVGYVRIGTIYQSYSTGPVPVGGGGLVGGDWGGLDATTCYWDTTTSGRTGSYGGMGRTTAQMITQSIYGGWDFTDFWWMVDGQTRPFLRMEWSTEIRNSHQLQMMFMNVAADYTLACDIDLSDITQPAQMWGTSTGSGAGFMPVNAFTGSLDGRNHTVTNLYIHRPLAGNIGLLGYFDGAYVRNIGLVDVDITGSSTTGGLIAENYATVSNAYVTGTVAGTDYSVGGLVGSNYGSISRSHSSAAVSSDTDSVGGLVGYNEGTISICYASGAVSATLESAGGLVGSNFGMISNTYASGSVSSVYSVGGLVGYHGGVSSEISDSYSIGQVSGFAPGGLVGVIYNSAPVIGCFWDRETSGAETSAGGTGLTTAQMKTRSTYEAIAWDLTTVWWAEDGYYPLLAEPGASGGGGGGGGAQFPALHSVTWDPVKGLFLACGDTGGLSSVYYVWPHQIDTLVPVAGTPPYTFNAIAIDHLGNILVGGNGLDTLHYYDSGSEIWHTIPDSAGSMTAWNIAGITFNPNDNRFYIVGDESGLGGVAIFTDIAPLDGSSKCHRDQSGFPESHGSLRSVEWNHDRDYALAVGDGVYRLNPYDGNPSYTLSWTVIASPHPDNAYLDISWDTDGWNEAAIVGRNQTFGNYWRYYDSNPQLIQGYKDPVSGTKYRTCAFKPPASPKSLLIPTPSGGIQVNVMEKDESGEIRANVIFPQLYWIGFNESFSPFNSQLDTSVHTDSTYFFSLQANYSQSWANCEVIVQAWHDRGLMGSEGSAYPDETDENRTLAFTLTWAVGTADATVAYPSSPELEITSGLVTDTPLNVNPGIEDHHLVRIPVWLGPQMRVADGGGFMARDPAFGQDMDAILLHRDSWDFNITVRDVAWPKAYNTSYGEFGVNRYASVSVSGNPVGSIPPGATATLASPSYISYSINAPYTLNVSIPHLLKDSNPAQNITANNVQVNNTHFIADGSNSEINNWAAFSGPDQARCIWGLPGVSIDPAGNGTESAGPGYSNFTAYGSFQATQVFWRVTVPPST